MFEQAANRILLDFEVIVLIALVLGLLAHALLGSFRDGPGRGVGSEFQPVDLVLIWFPLAFFLINPLMAQFGSTGGKPPGPPPDPGLIKQLVLAFSNLIYFIFIGVMTILVMQIVVVRDAVSMLGLRRLGWMQVAVCGVVGAALSVAICNFLAGSASSRFLEDVFGEELAPQLPIEQLQSAKSPLVIGMTAFLACIVAPLVEETLFRGYVYGVLKRFTGSMFAALISGALFAVVHMNLPALVPLWIFAILLCLAYEWSRCLWVPILIHALFNGFNIINLFLTRESVSGH